MGCKAPDRYEIMDREFPVRIAVAADPANYEATRRWLQRYVGTGNYASKPHIMWTAKRAHCVYFRDLHTALMFTAGCPHIRLISETYDGPRR